MLYYVRKAEPTDLVVVMELIAEGAKFLKEQNIPQWQGENEPKETILKADIKNGDCYLLIEGESVVGMAVLQRKIETTYATILPHEWQENSELYYTIHRITISQKAKSKGLAKLFLSYLCSEAYRQGVKDVRIDTHKQNKRMHHIIISFGFKFCGEIELPIRDGERDVYQLVMR